MIPPWRWPRVAATLARTFGARGAWLRAGHEARKRAARYRAAPRHAVTDFAPPAVHAFAVDAAAVAAATDRGLAMARAEAAAGGEYLAYGAEWRRFPVDPAGWLVHPGTGKAFAGDVPWWRLEHLDRERGDIKDVWEPARFAWAYDLVRAWLLTGDDRWPAAFHARLAEWVEACPPFRGPHWGCGQETAIRAVALLYAEAAFRDAPATTPEARRRLVEVLAASGERIADAFGYALSQRNNHGFSEAAGLVALGERLRGRHPEAAGWLETGRRALERLAREQFAPDGWYAQHSFNYARVSLDQCVVAMRALRAAGTGLSSEAVGRLRAGAELLAWVMDPATGVPPNHGANDGALVHPVSLAAYRDYRPMLTALAATFGFPLPGDVRPDAEALAWLGLPAPAAGPVPEDGVRSGASGWAAARVGGTAAFLRAGRWRSRPSHLDPLQLDVRFGHREVVVDAGTFAYNAPPPWRNGLAGAEVHNGPVADGVEPGVRGPRFLWLLWPEAALLRAEMEGPAAAVLAGALPNGARRTVRVEPGRVTVEDEAPSGARELVVRWLLHPDADPEQVRVEGESRLFRGEEGSTPGWFSPTYGARTATWCREAVRTTPCRLVTRIEGHAQTMLSKQFQHIDQQ